MNLSFIQYSNNKLLIWAKITTQNWIALCLCDVHVPYIVVRAHKFDGISKWAMWNTQTTHLGCVCLATVSNREKECFYNEMSLFLYSA